MQDRNYINVPYNGRHKKSYVEVRAYFSKEGEISPDEVIWEDGRHFTVERVREVRKAAAFKAGGCGDRYTCIICGKETYLFLDGTRWFVEEKKY